MPRHALSPGEWGEISISPARSDGPRKYRARTRFCGGDGRLVQVERYGRTRRAAQAALTDALTEMAMQCGSALSSGDTFETAARQWLEDVEQLVRMGQRSPSTLARYVDVWERQVRPALGGLRLRQVTTPVVDRFVVGLHEKIGAATARTARTVVSGVMGRAVREGAVMVNPARDIRRLSAKPKRQPRALTDEERAQWFVSLAHDPKAQAHDLPDLCAFLLATGVRIGEALAVTWGEVDLVTGTVHVTSTLIRVKGQGLIRKSTKTDAGQRPLLLPPWAVGMLARRAAVGVGSDEPVFATIDGTFRDPRNVSRWLKETSEAAGLGWVTSHSWRKTTASVLDGSGLSARVIADQLGHSRVSMTQDVYLGRRSVDPRVVQALQLVNPLGLTQTAGETVGSDLVEGGE